MNEKQKNLLLTCIPYVTLVVTLLGFWFGMDTVYQRQSAAAADKQQTIQTFEMMQQQIDTSVKEMQRNNQIADLNRQLNFLTEYKYKIMSYLREHEDVAVREELESVNTQISEVKEKLNNLLIGPQ